MKPEALLRLQQALIVKIDEYSRYFQECIGSAIETAGFEVDNHRQETTKTLADFALCMSIHADVFPVGAPATPG
jgi:hypothetical protein